MELGSQSASQGPDHLGHWSRCANGHRCGRVRDGHFCSLSQAGTEGPGLS